MGTDARVLCSNGKSLYIDRYYNIYDYDFESIMETKKHYAMLKIDVRNSVEKISGEIFFLYLTAFLSYNVNCFVHFDSLKKENEWNEIEREGYHRKLFWVSKMISFVTANILEEFRVVTDQHDDYFEKDKRWKKNENIQEKITN